MPAMTQVAAALRVAEPNTARRFPQTLPCIKGGPDVDRLALSLLAVACALSVTGAYAQPITDDDASLPYELDSTTITATRTPNSRFALPASVSTIDRQQLEDAQANTLSTVLRALPNVNYGGGPRAAAQARRSVACRGRGSS